jgi:hypothetical protein|tara:strand:- start:797 stop:1165 length:369 start_codon:yes stop_codon:yes gene_type:complete
MQILTLNINGDINASLQVGDIAYYSSPGTVATSGFATVNTGSIKLIGAVTEILNDSSEIKVLFDETLGPLPPTEGDYIMFAKNKMVNSSSLAGYYADVKFKNYSTDKIEMFSVGSEISESSK